ncbi:MAG: ORF6N domain-containing protein [Bacteroidaceae bacterium]|nr:ORF6N domain-containing protein [Bacteroidaceae bacterium]
MAKKKKKTEELTEPVANCNQSKVVVTVRDNQQLKVTNYDLKSINIDNLIRTIRGQKVMVDFDLAMLYGVKNKRLNEQVKRNIDRFPDDFMFQLTKEEWNALRSQIATTKTPEDEAIALLRSQFATTKDLSKIRTQPYAFTRNGIGMLSSVLGSDTAVAMNIRIMRAFTASQQIMEANAILFQRVFHLEQHQQETDEKINHILTKMDEQTPKLLPEQIFQTGCVWDAWTYVSDLVRNAKMRIVLIDNFVDDRVLSLLDKRADGVTVTIHSRFSEQFQTDLKKHNEQYPVINFVQLPHKNHDRFLILDNEVYLLGASVKDMGAGLCAVTKLQTSPEKILGLLK